MASLVSTPTLVGHPRSPARAGWGRQAILFTVAYLLYSLSRWVVVGDETTAIEHAHWALELEQSIGIAVEASVQSALRDSALMWVLNHAYIAAQVVVVPGVLIWLYRRDAGAYCRLRDTVLATWLLAIPVFWLFPVAPPRLAGLGIADTITSQTGLSLDSKLTTSFYNPLAAVPSLHCGFALAVSLAIGGQMRTWWTRALALAWAPTIFLTVVATGNHFVFDIAAGIVITLLGAGLAELAARRRRLRSAV